MQKITEIVEKRIARISEDLSKSVEDEPLTAEERTAIAEAEYLAERYADVTPDITTVSDSYLFRVAENK